jgi:hypothetical protein
MKKQIFFLLFFTTMFSNAQNMRGFVSVKPFYNGFFKNKGFASGGVGLEYKFHQMLRGEIECSVYLGALPDELTRKENGEFKSILVRNFTAVNISFCPKIQLNVEEDGADDPGEIYLQIMPTYNISKIEGSGTFQEEDILNPSKLVSVSDTFKDIQHKLGIGVGLFTYLSEKTSESISLNVYCNFINFANSLNNLKFGGSKNSTVATFGFGFNYYFGFVKKKVK